MTDIVNTLRQRHHNVTGGNPLIEPFEGPTIFSEAADEIQQLRAERNDARREVCDWCSIFTNELPEDVAMKNGWDCFKEDGK